MEFNNFNEGVFLTLFGEFIRCYRIGQRNNVTIYRFITAGTVEEHMYARQVQKDGIRRTLMTSTGCATERHFSKNDLKELFVLSPKGECKMLEKINVGSSDKVQGSSGRRSVLEKHDGVLGISSHDMVYTNTIVDLSRPDQSPFAGTPPKSSRTKLLSSKHLTFEDLARDAMPLQPSTMQHHVLNTQEHCLPPIIVKEKNAVTISVEQNAISQKSTTELVKDHSKPVDDDFNIVESLTKNGKFEESLNVLLRMLESDLLQGAPKLRVHKMIASRKLFLVGNNYDI